MAGYVGVLIILIDLKVGKDPHVENEDPVKKYCQDVSTLYAKCSWI